MADAQDQQDPTDSDTAKLAIMRRISLVVDVLLICGCGYLLARDISNALYGTPEFVVRGGAFLVNLSATFALVHRSMALLQRFWPRSPARKWVGILKWIAVFVLPLLAALQIEHLTWLGHRAQLDALVEDISSRAASALTAHALVRAEDLAAVRGPYLRELTVRADTGAFLLHTWVPGLGIDGDAVRYSSTEGVWYRDPYDAAAQTAPLFDAMGPLLVCRADNQQLQCEGREP